MSPPRPLHHEPRPGEIETEPTGLSPHTSGPDDPAGHTEQPTGLSDSIPTCLEP